MKFRLAGSTVAVIALATSLGAAPAPTSPGLDAKPAPTPTVKLVRPAFERFAAEDPAEIPDFQRHVLPVMGRMGCNTRSCHGSFQGRGNFRLSLFGYDFKADHDALMLKDSGRVDVEAPELSKIIEKPTLAVPHKGGKRLTEGTWQYHLLYKWIEGGAKGVENPARFERLEVSPAEIVFDGEGKSRPLKVVAHWSDGAAEDVTCLSRFRTNDEGIAEVDEAGVVTCKGKGDTHVVAFYDNGVAVTQVILPVSENVGAKYPNVPTPTKIDALVVAKLRKQGIVPSDVCTDAEFLRRLSVDLTGSLPTPEEVQAFLADTSPRKRAAKVDELLARPAYAAWWTTRLCDITGDNPRLFNGNPMNEPMARHWYAWIEKRVRENMPYDKLVAGLVLAASRTPGQSYEDYTKQETSYFRDKDPVDFSAREDMPYFWARNNFRTNETKALGFSYAFLGVRLECAQCHKHPFDQWTQDDFKQFTAFFAPIGYGIAPDARKTVLAMREELGLTKLMGGQQQREIGRLAKLGKPVPWQEVFINAGNRPAPPKGKAAKQAAKNNGNRVATPKLLGGDVVDISRVSDPRQPLMDWMRSKDNPYFARAFINRVWATYFGRGIVNPPDDMNQANPPSNAALLDYLSQGFIAHDFDMKWLHREIARSDTYQRSWKTNATNRLDEKNFSRSVVRRLPAEVLVDAVQQVTSNTKDLAQAATKDGLAERAIGPKGGATVARRGNGGDFAAKVFGRSTRETTCDCQASNEPNLLQSIYLQNDQELLNAIERPNGWLNQRASATAKSVIANRAAAETQVSSLKTRIKDLEKQAKTFRDAGKDKAVKDTQLQLSKRRDDLKAAEARLEKLANIEIPPPFEADAIVREAYLRTLGRTPTDAETRRALGYIAAAGDNAKGMRDLLWALLNTKEFVTNH